MPSNPGPDNLKILLSHYATVFPCVNVWQYMLLTTRLLFIILTGRWQKQIP